MSEKTVFISYRRDAAGKAFARSLAEALTHRGYDVFLDVDSIDAGRWAEQITTQVPARAHFLLVLTPGALDRCGDEADWVRREVELAVRHGRNIVPVREESVDLAAARRACPEGMKSVFDLQVAEVRHGSFAQDIETLVARYIPTHKAPKPAVAVPRVRASPPRSSATPPRPSSAATRSSRTCRWPPGCGCSRPSASAARRTSSSGW